MFLTAYFCSDESLNAGAFSSKVEACRTVKAVAVEQSHCGHLQCGGGCHQVLRQGTAFEKTESRTGVKLNVHQPQSAIRPEIQRRTQGHRGFMKSGCFVLLVN